MTEKPQFNGSKYWLYFVRGVAWMFMLWAGWLTTRILNIEKVFPVIVTEIEYIKEDVREFKDWCKMHEFRHRKK